MIYVGDDQVEQVNYLLEQSSYGNHILFSTETLKRVFRRKKSKNLEKINKAEKLMEEMILFPTIERKQHFLAQLDPEMHDQVAHLYFEIVQKNALEKNSYLQ